MRERIGKIRAIDRPAIKAAVFAVPIPAQIHATIHFCERMIL
jgi:hypothetical protein